MSWQQLILSPQAPRDIETLSDWLLEHGANAVTLQDGEDQPILEPLPGETPLWQSTKIVALFASQNDIKTTIQALQADFSHIHYSQETLADKNWERVCMDDFQPMRFGQRLWICPSWTEAPVPEAINLCLDPGLAFGTGTHPTTALCLSWLDAANIETHHVIDYGCGSGILAIAALKLGAAMTWAVDIDEQALEASQANAKRNGITNTQLQLSLAKDFHSQPVDLLMANILALPLLELRESFTALLKPGGTLIMSGILSEQIPLINEAYQSSFQIIDIKQQDDWAMIEAQKL